MAILQILSSFKNKKKLNIPVQLFFGRGGRIRTCGLHAMRDAITQKHQLNYCLKDIF